MRDIFVYSSWWPSHWSHFVFWLKCPLDEMSCTQENITSASLLPTIFYFVYLLIIRPVCLCYHPLTCDTQSMVTMMNCSLQIWGCSCGIKTKKIRKNSLLKQKQEKRKKRLPLKKKNSELFFSSTAMCIFNFT